VDRTPLIAIGLASGQERIGDVHDDVTAGLPAATR
jgi:hypothetical protein